MYQSLWCTLLALFALAAGDASFFALYDHVPFTGLRAHVCVSLVRVSVTGTFSWLLPVCAHAASGSIGVVDSRWLPGLVVNMGVLLLACVANVVVFTPGAVPSLRHALATRASSWLPRSEALWCLIVVLPLLEEVFYRGFMLHLAGASLHVLGVPSVMAWVAAVGVQACWFAANHADRQRFVVRCGRALVYGALACVTGSVWAPTVAHVMNNYLSWILGDQRT